jgi:DNA-binding winged helix-turn-helix (wHTH) protein/Tfp pilus assembly protein PilF
VNPRPGKVPDYRFGVFELDEANSTLRTRSGEVVRLQQQPFRLLALLLSRHGELIGREDIRKHLWHDETFVDFEHSVNFCIRQIRAALGDDAKSPRYIETVPRKGYRFIAIVERGSETSTARQPVPLPAQASSRRPRIRFLVGATAGLVCAAIALVWYLSPYHGTSSVAGADVTAGDAAIGSDSPLARDAFFKGRYLWLKGTNGDLEQALHYFQEAVSLDPSFATAHAAVADTFQLLANQGARAARDAFPQARSAAERALSLSPKLAEAKMVLGTVLFRFDWNWTGADEALRSAVQLNSKSAAARHDYAWFLISMKRFDEGIIEIRKAHELDPVSLRANVDIGWALLRAGQIDEAIVHLRRILELEPDFFGAQHCLEAAYTYKGQYDEALDFALRALKRNGADVAQIPGADQRDAKSAMQAIWRWQLQRLEQRAAIPQPYYIASYHAMLGNRDLAFKWLDRAFDDRDPSLVAVHVDNAFANLRNDARFQNLIRRIGLPN